MKLTRVGVTVCFLALVAGEAVAQGRLGVRGGIGTDVSLGIAAGAELNYGLPAGANVIEIGVTAFYGSFTDESSSSCCTYKETTDILVFGALANYLLAVGTQSGLYLVAGGGGGAINVSWREESPDDTSLGPSLPGGGSFQEEDGTVGGFILNVGIGYRFTERVDLRFQVPTFFTGEVADGASTTIPTFTLSLGLRF